MAGIATYDPTVRPPQAFEAVEAVAGVLRALDAGPGALVRPADVEPAAWPYLQAAADVFVHRMPATPAPVAVVVRELVEAGGPRRGASGKRALTVQVAATISAELPRPDTLLAALHGRIYAALEGARLTLTRSVALLPLRMEGQPTGAVYDPERDRYVSAAHYEAVLQGIRIPAP